jgi:hypothetical protein
MIKQYEIPDDVKEAVFNGCALATRRPDFTTDKDGNKIPNPVTKEEWFDLTIVSIIKKFHEHKVVRNSIDSARDTAAASSAQATKDIKLYTGLST